MCKSAAGVQACCPEAELGFEVIKDPARPTPLRHDELIACADPIARPTAGPHGGQVAFYCAAAGIKLASLVTITMPQRADMEDVYRAGLENIGT